MKILGLTGGIAMGKSTVAGQFAKLGAKVCSSDQLVHALVGPGGSAVEAVAKLYPPAREGNAIDRTRLGQAAFADPALLKKLEALLHPLVRAEERRFLRQARKMGARMVVLEIPLLYETRAEKRCQKVAVVTAPGFLQRRRAFARSGMREEVFRSILARQLPDAQKRRRADFVIPTGLGLAYSFRRATAIVRRMQCSAKSRSTPKLRG